MIDDKRKSIIVREILRTSKGSLPGKRTRLDTYTHSLVIYCPCLATLAAIPKELGKCDMCCSLLHLHR